MQLRKKEQTSLKKDIGLSCCFLLRKILKLVSISFSVQFSNSASNIIIFLISLLLLLLNCILFPPYSFKTKTPHKFSQKSSIFSQKLVLFHKIISGENGEKTSSSFFSVFPDFDKIFTFF
jgi:hypothetical protein